MRADSVVVQPAFEHRHRDLHHIEHDALNAELRGKVEVPMRDWGESIKGVADFVARTAPLGEVANARLLTSIGEYREGYHCTEDLTETLADVLERYELTAVPERLCSGVRLISAYDAEQVFVELSGAANLLPPEVLDGAAHRLECLDVATAKPVSSCTIALHHTSHFDPTVSLREELRGGAPHLRDKEVILEAVRDRRNAALKVDDVVVAREAMQEEVVRGSELVSTNMLRMGLFSEAEIDVANFKEDADALGTAARGISAAFATDVAEKPGLEAGIASVRKIIAELTQRQVDEQTGLAERVAAASARVSRLADEEASLWGEIVAKLAKLNAVNTEKQDVAERVLGDVERTDRVVQGDGETIRLLQTHLDRLRAGVHRADQMSHLGRAFEGYVASMSLRLQDAVEDAEDAVRQLKIAEAALVLSRYDRFSDATEDMCQRTRNRLERLEQAKRQRQLDGEVAASTLDPDGAAYDGAVSAIDTQITNLKSYLGTLVELGEARRADVDPTIEFALGVVAEEPSDGPKVLRGDTTFIDTGSVPRKSQRAMPTADSPSKQREVEITKHPQLLAALRSLDDDGVQLLKAKGYIEGEQFAVESRLADVRRLAVRTKNARQSHTPLLGDRPASAQTD